MDGLCFVNNKEISNCKVQGTIIPSSEKTSGITQTNNGLIHNCINEADIQSSAQYAYGIAYTNNGTIINSCNKGKISSYNARAGIVGSNNQNGIVRYCCNLAEIDLSAYHYIGGGICQDNYGIVESCYNAGTIKLGAHNIGGIIGRNFETGIITNCYNVGNVKTGNTSTIAAIVGSNLGTIDKCYYLNTTSNSAYGSSSTGTCTNSEVKSEDEMKNINFIELLNSHEENIWKSDESDINKGYPILNWQ